MTSMLYSGALAARLAQITVAVCAAGILATASSQAAVFLSSPSFSADHLPTIHATAGDISAAQAAAGAGGYYKLRAKISVPYAPGYYHAIDATNNNGARLTSVPGTGSFVVDLYWVAYAVGGAVTVGPFNTQSISIGPPVTAGASGLREDYFGNANFTNLTHTVPSGSVPDYNWGGGGPAWTGSDNFSVRWSGLIEPVGTEPYTFTTGSDDGMRVFVGDMSSPLAGSWGDHPYEEASGTRVLEAGRSYAIMVEYFENIGAAEAKLFWSSPTIQKQIVPVTHFRPATVGNVINLPPAVVTSPASQTVDAGANVWFWVVVNGSPFPNLQWRKNGVPIPGATGVIYNIPSASVDHVGGYSVAASNSSGSVISGVGTLGVNAVAGPGNGNGLAGHYYNGSNFSSFVTARVDPSVGPQTNWSTGRPAMGVGYDDFSVRWIGKVEAPVSGSYVFSVYCDDGVRVKLNGSTIIDQWYAGSKNVEASPVSLIAGIKYDLVVEYYEGSGDAFVELYWQPPNAPNRSIIPQERLYSPPVNNLPGVQQIVNESLSFEFFEELDENENPTGNWITTPKSFTIPISSSGALQITTSGTADPYGTLRNEVYTAIANLEDGGMGANIDVLFLLGGATTRYVTVLPRYNGNVNESFALTVSFRPDGALPQAPAITSANSTTFPLSHPLGVVVGEFQIVATGTPAPTFSIVQGQLPAGVFLNPTTGLISGVATVSGSYPLIIEAINYAGTFQQSFTLNVSTAPVTLPEFSNQPQSQIVTAGATARFLLAVTGVPAPTLQWERFVGGSWAALSNIPPYSGTTTTELVISDTTLLMSGYEFRCIATNSVGTATSSPVLLTVQDAAGPGTFVVTTPAGLGGSLGYVDNPSGPMSRFNEPTGLASDGTNLYISDQINNVVRKMHIASGAVTTFATGLNGPSGVALDNSGKVYVASTSENKIKVFSPSGSLVLTVGTGGVGSANGPLATATFSTPIGVAVNSSGTVIYVTDYFNELVRRVDVPGNSVTTMLSGFRPWNCALSADDASLYVTDYLNGLIKKYAVTAGNTETILSGTYSSPRGVAVDNSGKVYVAEAGAHVIRRIDGTTVTTIAGASGVSGTTDGAGANARFQTPFGIHVSGNSIFVGDAKNHTIRRLLPEGAPFITSPSVATFAQGVFGSFVVTATGAPPPTISLYSGTLPAGVSFQAGTATISGTALTAGTYPVTLRAASTTGEHTQLFTLSVTSSSAPGAFAVTTPAGLGGSSGNVNNANGPLARFNEPSGVATDGAFLYIADQINHAIRKMNLSSGAVSTIVPSGTLTYPPSVTVDASGNIFVADYGVHRIRRFDSSGTLNLSIGNGSSGAVDSTLANSSFYVPLGVAADSTGNYIYVADTYNDRVRRIDISGNAVTTIATGFRPWSVALSGDGTSLYVTDYSNGLIKKIAVTAGNTITTLAGSNYSMPRGVGVDSAGGVYVVQSGIGVITRILGSVVANIAGSPGTTGTADGAGPDARFTTPFGIVAVSPSHLLVGDAKNHTIRRLLPDSAVPIILTHPISLVVTPGTNVSFTVTVNGSGLAYQWQRRVGGTGPFVSIANGGSYSGATTNTLAVSGATLAMTGDQFLCVVTGPGGSTQSAAAVLTVTNGTPDTTNQLQLRVHTPNQP